MIKCPEASLSSRVVKGWELGPFEGPPTLKPPALPGDIYSEAKRNAANEWFKNTLMSRLDDKRTGAIVIVMQRVHIDDLTGFVQSLSDDWEVLSLPAIAQIDEDMRFRTPRPTTAGWARRYRPSASPFPCSRA